MSFLYLVLISISSFFVVRIGNKSVNSFQVSSLVSSILFIVLYFVSYPTFSLLSLHFIFTGLCLIFLIISYYEILNLEKKIIDLKIDRILLDNFSPTNLKKALRLIPNKIETEASGNINKSNILNYAKTGVKRISLGYLTHSVKNFDFSLEY